MTAVGPAPAVEQVQLLRDFAALSGRFDPADALTAVQDPAGDPELLVALSAELARWCDTRLSGGGEDWLMRGPERRWALDDLASRRDLAEAVGWRRRFAADGGTADLLDALLGANGFAPDAVRGVVAERGPRDELARLAVGLERAGRLAPAFDQLDGVRAALARLDGEERGSVLLDAGVPGRAFELAAIARWLATPFGSPPVRALFVAAPPGRGKSTVLEEAVRRARTSDRRWMVARLDFERRGLDVSDPTGLTIELTRQLAGEMSAEAAPLREARLAAAGASAADPAPRLKGTARERVPVALAEELARQVRGASRPVLLVLDTVEVLRARGETHPARLFGWVDTLVGLGAAPIAVLAAGRGDALDGVPERVGARLELPALDGRTADDLLAALHVPPGTVGAVRDVAGGDPRLLRLAATAVRTAHWLPGPDAALGGLVSPSVVVRRVSAEVITEVLAPQAGQGPADDATAAELFAELSRQTWLVEPDPVAPGFLRYRPDVRSVLLRRLYETRRDDALAVDAAAADWFGARPEPWAAVEAAYHRLQLMRRDPQPPAVDAELLRRLDADTIAELPPAAQDVVRRARGERSSAVRGPAAPGRGPVRGAATELAAIVERGDWLEGGYVYERAFRDVPIDPRSPEADAALAFLWRSGQWTQARRVLHERDQPRPDDADLSDLPAHLAAPRLEMRAEFDFAAFARALRRDEGVARLVSDIAYCGFRSELSDGALGFAARRAGRERRARSWGSADVVSATFGVWHPSPHDAPRQALAGATERLARRLAAPVELADRSEGAALLLAALTPYVDAAVTLGRCRGDPAAERHAAAVDAQLPRLGGLLPAGAPTSRMRPQPLEPIDGLATLGLFAEWAGAAGFLLDDHDLGLIAASAERWRRTAAGQWSFDTPPATWRSWTRPLDVTVADRLAALTADDDAVRRSREQLAAWAGGNRGPSLPDLVAARLPGALTPAREAVPHGPATVAAALLARRVPAAFVPPLAVLLVHREL